MGLSFSSVAPGNNIVIDVRQLILGMSELHFPLELPLTHESYQTTVNISTLVAVLLSSLSTTRVSTSLLTGVLWHTMDTNSLLSDILARVWKLLCRTFSITPPAWL
jgi:hypothetical protein